ncbi:MAG: hypothetical protein AB1736_15120 [Chloroflexota bacterium]
MTVAVPRHLTWPGRWPRATLVALAAGGTAFTLIQIVIGSQAGLFPIPPGDTLIWDRVGDGLRDGDSIYYTAEPLTDSFWYAPPWAVLFAATSWLPTWGLHLVFVAVKVLSLRVIAGSWLGAGLAAWFPLVAFDLASGSFNLLMAAAIVAAVRGRPELAVVASLAKFGPLLAIDPRQWRTVLPVALVAALITLPWLSLWPAWIDHLAANVGSALGPQLPIPLLVRWALAMGLLALRRPSARALAATIAIPAFYWGSLVILIAPIAVWLRDRQSPEAA